MVIDASIIDVVLTLAVVVVVGWILVFVVVIVLGCFLCPIVILIVIDILIVVLIVVIIGLTVRPDCRRCFRSMLSPSPRSWLSELPDPFDGFCPRILVAVFVHFYSCPSSFFQSSFCHNCHCLDLFFSRRSVHRPRPGFCYFL